MSQKHFNKGTVWGTLLQLTCKTTSGNTPYLMLKIKCPDTIVYGKLWGGVDVTGPIISHHSQNPGTLYKFIGFLSQYKKKKTLFSNFNFFKWELAEPTAAARAAFVLVGDVISVNGDELKLYLERNGGKQTEEFTLYATETALLGEIAPGQMVKVKGFVRRLEDEYGDTDGEIRPQIKEVKAL